MLYSVIDPSVPPQRTFRACRRFARLSTHFTRRPSSSIPSTPFRKDCFCTPSFRPFAVRRCNTYTIVTGPYLAFAIQLRDKIRSKSPSSNHTRPVTGTRGTTISSARVFPRWQGHNISRRSDRSDAAFLSPAVHVKSALITSPQPAPSSHHHSLSPCFRDEDS